MDIILQLFDFILHIDEHLAFFLADYGMWIYGILFLIIFVETGLVVMPFLPGTVCCSQWGIGGIYRRAKSCLAYRPIVCGSSTWRYTQLSYWQIHRSKGI